MKQAQWYDVLEPRAAVIAGIVGLAIVWALCAYLRYGGHYAAWGISPTTSKNFGTLAILLGFALPYWLLRWWVKPSPGPGP
jgi:hypothetical protein